MQKVRRDGQVAVLYSPGYGAGWSTWNSGIDVFDPEMVEALEAGADLAALKAIARREYPNAHTGGLEDIEIAWVPQGSRFEITEYDGYEEVRIFDPEDWYIA